MFAARDLTRYMMPAMKRAFGSSPLPARKAGSFKLLAAFAARRLLAAILFLHALYIGTTLVLILCYSFIDPPVTVLALTRKYLDGFTVRKHYPVKLAAVPRTTRRMLVSIEDGNFWNHAGIDFEAVKRAAEINKNYGKILYGGSTLTMQLARTLFLVPSRNYFRKYLEVIVALELELVLSKERILELYLSWAEWGKGVFGIDAASRQYFKKSAGKLTIEESARLMALLSSPIKYNAQNLLRSNLLRARYEYLMGKYGS